MGKVCHARRPFPNRFKAASALLSRRSRYRAAWRCERVLVETRKFLETTHAEGTSILRRSDSPSSTFAASRFILEEARFSDRSGRKMSLNFRPSVALREAPRMRMRDQERHDRRLFSIIFIIVQAAVNRRKSVTEPCQLGETSAHYNSDNNLSRVVI